MKMSTTWPHPLPRSCRSFLVCRSLLYLHAFLARGVEKRIAIRVGTRFSRFRGVPVRSQKLHILRGAYRMDSPLSRSDIQIHAFQAFSTITGIMEGVFEGLFPRDFSAQRRGYLSRSRSCPANDALEFSECRRRCPGASNAVPLRRSEYVSGS